MQLYFHCLSNSFQNQILLFKNFSALKLNGFMCIWVDFNDDQAFWGTINNDEAKNYKRAWNNQLSFLLPATPAVVVKGRVG